MEKLLDAIRRREQSDVPMLPNTETLIITPQCADFVINNRKHTNRPLRQLIVERIARDIENDNYFHNGQTIVFGRKNSFFLLLTGQHRMEAVLCAGKSIISECNFSAPIESQITIDNTPTRQAGETLSLTHPGLKNPRECSTAARFLYWLERGYELWSATLIGKPLSSIEINDTYLKYPDLPMSVSMGMSAAYVARIGFGVQLGIIHHHISYALKCPPLATQFLEQLKSGERLTKNDPLYQYREWIFKTKTSIKITTHVTRETKIKALTLATNSFLRGRTMNSMNVHLNNIIKKNKEQVNVPVPIRAKEEQPKLIRDYREVTRSVFELWE